VQDTRQAMVTAKSPEHPLAPPPQKPEHRRRWPFIGGVLVALLASGVYIKYFRKPLVVVVTDAANTKDLPTQDLPPAVALTDNADALAAYQEGVQEWRDGSIRRSRTSLERAVGLDAGFAAANLEIALQMVLARESSSGAQERYQKAYSHRDRLPPRDKTLLSAIDALVRPTQDLSDAETKLESAAAKFKQDPMFPLVLGYVREARSDFEQARTDYEQAISRDGSFMPAQLAKGHVLEQLGNPDAALEAYGKCIRASSAAAICLEQRMLLLRNRGECAAMEQDARAWQGVEPEAYEPSYYVAEALMARGQPIESIEISLRHSWDAMGKEERASSEAEDRANLALAQGDFQTAERATNDWDAARMKPEVMQHTGPQQQLAYIAYETGDIKKAGRIADAFLRIAPALTPSPDAVDPTIWTQEYLFRNNAITKADLETKRQAWLKERQAGRTQQENMRLGPFLWAHLYAAFAESPEEAKDALDKLPDYLPLPPPSRRTVRFEAWLGKAYALAGKADDAIPSLRTATNACMALEEPIMQTRSFYFLGMALETKGDLESSGWISSARFRTSTKHVWCFEATACSSSTSPRAFPRRRRTPRCPTTYRRVFGASRATSGRTSASTPRRPGSSSSRPTARRTRPSRRSSRSARSRRRTSPASRGGTGETRRRRSATCSMASRR
jgi:tetratricopeptide (TPR) repeat protein